MISNPESPRERGSVSINSVVRSLILRAWLEPGFAPQLKVRVIEIAPMLGERSVGATTSVDEACRVVRSWLETINGEAADAVGDGSVTPRG